MSYIDVQFNKFRDEVIVWERTSNGISHRTYPAPYYFYVPDPNGQFTSLFGDKLKRLDFDNFDDYNSERELMKSRRVRTFESDIQPDIRVLMDNYLDKEVPKIHYTFLDIEAEVDTDQPNPFPSFNNPYAPVNAITLYHQWQDRYLTFAVAPKGWKDDDPNRWNFLKDNMTLVLCRNERELLEKTINAIQDTDVLSGWNSDFFDMPYLFKRTELVLGKSWLKMWTFEKAREPGYSEVERFGSKEVTVRMTGRQHLDYLGLFKKFNLGGRASYSLQSIAEEELDESKVQFDGTLEELYEENFDEFVRYNIHDVTLLVKLDQKFKYMTLANTMAHENTVRFPAVLGTVAYVETGLTNYAHKDGIIVNDKPEARDQGKVEGAIVLTPNVGLHPWVGSVDINSLYPNTIRSLNMSPEKIIGQFENGEDDWRGIWQRDEEEHTLMLEDGSYATYTGKVWRDEILPAQKWAVTGFGSVFDQGNGIGLIPKVLGLWFKERKQFQAEKKKYAAIAKEQKAKGEDYTEAKTLEEYYDILQGVKKVQLNSTYGALLSVFFRFNRRELGGSTTATGRQITTHMNQTIGEMLSGVPTKLIKETIVEDDGEVINVYRSDNPVLIAADTDSCYFTMEACTNLEEAVELADTVAEAANATFPDFMRDAFNCQEGFDELIKAGREVVAERGIFIARKKYVLKVLDLEGARVNKLKSMGVEMKKSDTPKPIQEFLEKVTKMVLDGIEKPQVIEFIMSERERLFKDDLTLLALGVTKAVNKFDKYWNEYSKQELTGKGKVKLPGHVRAACNWNVVLQRSGDKKYQAIHSGDKVKVLYLKGNPDNLKSIAFPTDMDKFPKWFMDRYEIDTSLMEEKLIDMKLKGIFAALDWEISTKRSQHIANLLEFD